jgi:Mannosylglycerate hydrolase MGH1-like glycoside hydrolase domain
MPTIAEQQRIEDDTSRRANWKRWGPYLSERQWATVREDYSAWGDCWDYFPHDDSRSRAYRWGEDGLLGWTDRECRLCFALALWNGKDPILKERLFGLTGPEGNHGEDVKEQYFYLAATPTYSYAKALYKYPQAEFPYTWLVNENRRRGKLDPEFELVDTGIFNENRYFDVFVEYAKNSPDDILIRLTVANRGPEAATLHLLPNIWFRNDWSWGKIEERSAFKPSIALEEQDRLSLNQESLGRFFLCAGADPSGRFPTALFTENETNAHRLWGIGEVGAFVKDAFHEYLIQGNSKAVNPANTGTKAALHYVLIVPAGMTQTISLRLFPEKEAPADPLGASFNQTLAVRVKEANEFYDSVIQVKVNKEERQIILQAAAGLLWSKQFYHYIVADWLSGDPAGPTPPSSRLVGRNHNWPHLYSRNVISMPDKWEYPWFASWDLAFHVLPISYVDPEYSKRQLLLLLREWYMHPNGQIPAYEFAFGDVNPPVHAWAAWRIYKITAARGARDLGFLERVFQKLLLNFTWWVNRKDVNGENLFSGGFLGLDNIGLFDRSKPLPDGGSLRQADGTAWMAFYCGTMLSMALELAKGDGTHLDLAYEDMASKFFEHFVQIIDAINHLGGTGLWDEANGFYYDQLQIDGRVIPLETRSAVGLLPLIAVEVLEQSTMKKLPGFYRRFRWFIEHRPELARNITVGAGNDLILLAIPARDQLERVLRYMLDENEFLSPHGLRSVSKFHEKHPSIFNAGGGQYRVDYEPAESTTGLFGGNSNWRGPVWFPINFLLLEALERYDHFYGDSLQVECPTGSGRMLNLRQVALELSTRLAGLFLPDANGRRPCNGDDPRFATDPHWRDLVLFYEYFHGDTGRGLGASHQTGWTAIAISCIADVVRERGTK